MNDHERKPSVEETTDPLHIACCRIIKLMYNDRNSGISPRDSAVLAYLEQVVSDIYKLDHLIRFRLVCAVQTSMTDLYSPIHSPLIVPLPNFGAALADKIRVKAPSTSWLEELVKLLDLN